MEIKLSVKTFLAGILTGLIGSALFLKDFEQFQKLVEPIYEDIINVHPDFLTIFLSILQRNLTEILIIIFLGVLYKYLPLLPLFFNGALLGIFFYALIFFLHQSEKLLLLLPHGIFEIPALILAAALALRLTRIAKPANLWGRIKALPISKDTVALIILLLIIAASIETSSILLF